MTCGPVCSFVCFFASVCVCACVCACVCVCVCVCLAATLIGCLFVSSFVRAVQLCGCRRVVAIFIAWRIRATPSRASHRAVCAAGHVALYACRAARRVARRVPSAWPLQCTPPAWQLFDRIESARHTLFSRGKDAFLKMVRRPPRVGRSTRGGVCAQDDWRRAGGRGWVCEGWGVVFCTGRAHRSARNGGA
jgi:hypothetical protein